MPNSASGQELPAPESVLRVDTLDTTEHPKVTATVTVPPEFVGQELGATAFTVVEAGQALPAAVTQLPNDALQVVLVLDTSGSMKGAPLTAAREAALSFVSAMPPGVEIAVIGFGNEPEVLSEFSTDTTQATAALDRLDAGGETALYDALEAAAALFPADDGARRRVVLLSDGGDTVSEAPLEEAILGLLGASAGFSAVELTSPEQDSNALQRLATAVDGRVVGAGDPAALDSIFKTIASDLVNQYQLSYQTNTFGPTEVTISVAASGVTASAVQAVRYPPPPTPAVDPAPRPVKPVAPVTTVGPEPAPERNARIVVPGPLSDPTALAIGGALVFLALLIGSQSMRVSKRTVAAMAKGAKRKRSRGSKKGGALSGITSRATLFAERTLERGEGEKTVGILLEQAGVRLRSGEFVVLAGSISLTLSALGTFLLSPLIGLSVGVVVLAAFRFGLAWKASRRRAAFGDQLGEILQLISGSIKAGYGLLQALEAAASESLPPTSEELQRLLVETQLGRDLPEALRAMADRVDSEDFRWVVEAIEIQRDVGGDLAEILQTVATTVRDRAGIRRRVRALSAEGRLSAYILIGLPFLVAGAISVTNPSYMAELTQSVAGKVMIGGGISLMVVGALWMRRIVRIVF
jgi:tight adherence protein B